MVPLLASVHDVNARPAHQQRNLGGFCDEYFTPKAASSCKVWDQHRSTATAVLLMASDAEAQQADQGAPAETAPKKKTKKKKGSASTTAAPSAKPKAQYRPGLWNAVLRG